MVGYFDFNTSPQPPGTPFHQFYLSALRVMSYGRSFYILKNKGLDGVHRLVILAIFYIYKLFLAPNIMFSNIFGLKCNNLLPKI